MVIATFQPSCNGPSERVARDSHAGEEDLVELAVARDRDEGPDLDAGKAHVDEHAGDALVLRRVGIGAHEQLAPAGQVPERVPHLLPVDDELVAVGHRPTLERREVGAGVGLAEALAPDVVASQHPRQEPALLLLGAPLDDRRCDVREADRIERARRTGAVHLFGEDNLVDDAGAAAAVLGRPRDRRVAGVGEQAVPGAQQLERVGVLRQPLVRDADEVGGEVGVEPGPHLGAERLGLGRVAEVHATPGFTAISRSARGPGR